MATTAMMLRSIPKPDEPEAKEMYWNLRNLVKRAMVQQDEVDMPQHTDMESRGTHMASSWSKGV
jgi:tRNA C32,U32 (ribose-2'-O)-methylase TrmJ